ncbi:FHA domain-containing protein [Humibacter sp.]|uniref:FHA domain-containing protein n=1 Tax=Humibacter sp. TaxID=1940291 RepID=UPI003F81CEA6
MAQGQPFGRHRGFVHATAPRPPEDDWIVIVGESFVALIEAAPGERGIQSLAALAGAAETELERVVSAIPVGENGVDSFAVVHFDADGVDGWQITAVARGRAVIDVYSVGGARRFSSSGMQPWLIATFRDVVAVELGGPARRFDSVARLTSAALPIGLGIANAGSVLWSAAAPERPVARETEDGADARARYARPPAALDDDTVRRPPASAPPGFDEETVRRSGPAMQVRLAPRSEPDELTVERASLFRPPPTPTPQLGALPAPTPQKGPVLPPAPTTAPLLPPAPATVVEPPSENGEVRGRVLVGIRGQEQIPLERPVVFGRRPMSTRRSGIDPLLVAVPSPGQEISASHVRIEPTGRVVVVTDLKSRNGTRVSVDGRRARRLRPGESFAVHGHAAVEIGDGTIIDITPVGLIS